MSITDDVFTVFISHKHDDHALAMAVKAALEGLSPRPGAIDCFVSDIDIAAGVDWRRAIRTILARSHLLILLFTAPSKNWDWCLYETGLYTRFDRTDGGSGVGSVVCLYNDGQSSPSPLADLQGVPANVDRVRAFLHTFCRETWKLSDDWRRGALVPDVPKKKIDAAAEAITRGFCRSGSASTYYPCHRLVLSLSESDDITDGIPEQARVVEGPGDTSPYTMSLFDLAGGSGNRTWGELLKAVDGVDAAWRHELDTQFLQALDERLFPPIKGRMRAAGMSLAGGRFYCPILYSIVRGPAVVSGVDAVPTNRKPCSVTLVLIPEPGDRVEAQREPGARTGPRGLVRSHEHRRLG